LKSTKVEAQRCARQSRDGPEATPEPSEVLDILGHGWQSHRTPLGGRNMTSKDKNTKKSMEKKPAQKTLKEKRQAKKAKH
jgi:hypothetical protein